MRGENDPEDGPRLQRALDEAPLGGDLHFPPGDFRTRQPLRVRRQLNLIGAGTRLTGDLASDPQAPLLEVNVEDPVNRDNRNQRIQGLRLGLTSGLGDALVIRNRAPNIANIGLIIEGNVISGPPSGPGVALRLEGIGTHHLTIRNNQIINGIHLASADGVTIEECLIFGEKTAITLDLIPGAFQTRILRNGIVSRDGALRVLAGSQIYFEYNQVEQFPGYGENRLTQGAHIALEPQRYGARHIRIRSNNFGGGGNARVGVFATGDCQDLLIDDNVFNLTSTGVDVLLAAASVAWTRLGPNNDVRQQGVARRADANAGQLAVVDRGTGSFGVEHAGSSLVPVNGWRAGQDFRFWKTLDGTLRFRGRWTPGALGPGTRIGGLPLGFRPEAPVQLALPTEDGEFTFVDVAVDGAIFVRRAASGVVSWAAASFAVAPRPAYPAADP